MKKILLDTNILISALVFKGNVRKLLNALYVGNYQLYVSQYIDYEFKAIVTLKWPNRAQALLNAYTDLKIPILESTNQKLYSLRDEKDVPVISDAIHNDIDIVLTGDKDFSDVMLEKPIICSPTEFAQFIGL